MLPPEQPIHSIAIQLWCIGPKSRSKVDQWHLSSRMPSHVIFYYDRLRVSIASCFRSCITVTVINTNNISRSWMLDAVWFGITWGSGSRLDDVWSASIGDWGSKLQHAWSITTPEGGVKLLIAQDRASREKVDAGWSRNISHIRWELSRRGKRLADRDMIGQWLREMKLAFAYGKTIRHIQQLTLRRRRGCRYEAAFTSHRFLLVSSSPLTKRRSWCLPQTYSLSHLSDHFPRSQNRVHHQHKCSMTSYAYCQNGWRTFCLDRQWLGRHLVGMRLTAPDHGRPNPNPKQLIWTGSHWYYLRDDILC